MRTYEVINGPVYFRVNGSMQEMVVGERVTLPDVAAESLLAKGWVKPVDEPKPSVIPTKPRFTKPTLKIKPKSGSKD